MSRTPIPADAPPYLRHAKSNSARIYINRQEIWLGPYDSPESWQKYDRIIAEWLAAGRQLPVGYRGPEERTVSEIIVLYMEHAKTEYSRNGQATREFANLKPPLRVVQHLYGSTPACQFGPKALKAVRERLLNQHLQPVEEGEQPLKQLSRKYVNQSIDRVRRMFRWAVEGEYIPASVIHALDAVVGLRRGKGGVETAKITIVPQPFIDALRPHVSRQVWALIQLQLWTGMRPGEAICLRGKDINTSGKLWEISPTEHKTAHFGIDRLIIIGPQGQEVLKPFLKTNLEAYLFSPQDAEAERFAAMREKRKSKVQPSQVCRKKAKPERRPQEHYTVDSYRRAIHRACNLADAAAKDQLGKQAKEVPADRIVPQWSPNRLRHNFATRMRREYGIETARILLGHTSASTTEIYAEADRLKALSVMERAG